MKKILETLIFKVRETLGSKGTAGAFWMGSLKHRNLEGAIIGSQLFGDEEVGSENESVDADEVLQSDDEEEEEEEEEIAEEADDNNSEDEDLDDY
jgi:Fanconi anemia group D2 protein